MMIASKSISPFLSFAEISPEHEAFSFFAASTAIAAKK
jgi:hypothetical protein